jgi:hypothetical protein
MEIYEKKDVMKHLNMPRLMQSEAAPVTICGNSNSDSFIGFSPSYSLFDNSQSRLKVVLWVKSQNDSIVATGLGSNSPNTDLSHTFNSNKNLRYIGCIRGDKFAKYTNTFIGCSALSSVFITSLKGFVSFASSNAISKTSVLYMIQNAAPTSDITITLHADAYARLAEDADIIEALEAQPLVTLVSA